MSHRRAVNQPRRRPCASRWLWFLPCLFVLQWGLSAVRADDATTDNNNNNNNNTDQDRSTNTDRTYSRRVDRRRQMKPGAEEQQQPGTKSKSGTTEKQQKETTEQTEEKEQTKPKPRPGEKPEIQRFGYDFFARAPDTFAPLDNAPVPPTYQLGPGDVIELTFWTPYREDETYELTVTPEGTVSLPLVGDFVVRDLTMTAFTNVARAQLGRFYKRVSVTATLTKLRSIQVFVAGAAQRPGMYTISSLSTAFNALYVAGGPSLQGSMRRIRVMRGSREVATIDLYDYLLTGVKTGDVPLQSGDTIFIPTVGGLVTVKGDVVRPAIYELKGGEKLLDVMHMAGGLQSTAYARNIRVQRVEENDTRILVSVDAAPLLAGSTGTENVAIMPGDIVEVTPIYPRIENAVEIEGEVKYGGSYAWRTGMTVGELIHSAGGLAGPVNESRGEIFRHGDDGRVKIVPFDVAEATSTPTGGPLLQPRDQVRLQPPLSVLPANQVTIVGPVQRPGRYQRLDGMRVSDLISAAGGIRPDATIVAIGVERVFTRPQTDARVSTTNPVKPAMAKSAPPAGSAEETKPNSVYIAGPGVQSKPLPYVAGANWDYYLNQVTTGWNRQDLDKALVYRASGEIVSFQLIHDVQPGDRFILPPPTTETEELTPRILISRGAVEGHTIRVFIDRKRLEDLDPDYDIELQDGDQVTLYTQEAMQWRGGSITVEGAVQRPGTYERTMNMTVADAIYRAGGLRPEAYKPRANVVHHTAEGADTIVPVDLENETGSGGAATTVVDDGDRIEVFTRDQAEFSNLQVTVDGAVQRPGTYPLSDGMTLRDLIFQAGGLMPEAYEKAEIARVTPDGDTVLLSANLPQLLTRRDESQNLVLHEGDHVSVPQRSPSAFIPRQVTVSGEVKRPGIYAISEHETLGSVIKRAGGFTQDAFPAGGSLRRRLTHIVTDDQRSAMQAVINESSRIAEREFAAELALKGNTQYAAQSSVARAGVPSGNGTGVFTETPQAGAQSTPTGAGTEGTTGASTAYLQSDMIRIAVDFQHLNDGNQQSDVQLADGDEIYIPRTPVTVMVVGAVMRPTSVLFAEHRDVNYYVGLAGGFSPDARSDNTVVIKANGTVLQHNRVREIERGDIIVVPSKAIILHEKQQWYQTVAQVAQAISGIATTALVVKTLKQ